MIEITMIKNEMSEMRRVRINCFIILISKLQVFDCGRKGDDGMIKRGGKRKVDESIRKGVNGMIKKGTGEIIHY